MESYKAQISELESKGSGRLKELDTLKFELEQAHTRLKISAEERAKDSDAIELYQERVRELELATNIKSPIVRSPGGTLNNHSNVQNLLAEVDNDPGGGLGLGGELDDAISGTTMTDLKLQVRKLTRDLEAAKSNQVDAGRVLVMENLLEDANRMKARYEQDYLAAHREKLVLQTELEEIRSGKLLGDGYGSSLLPRLAD